MYAFQTKSSARKKEKRIIRILLVVVFILTIALIAVSSAYYKQKASASAVAEALNARTISEADNAQSTVYRLTQSSGTNTMSLLSSIRSHVYALQSLNILASSIYGAETYLVQPTLLDACTQTLDLCEVRLQAGNVLTTQFTQLKDQIDEIAALFGL